MCILLKWMECDQNYSLNRAKAGMEDSCLWVQKARKSYRNRHLHRFSYLEKRQRNAEYTSTTSG